MSDNLNWTGIPDSRLVSLSEAWEVAYWTGKFICTHQQLKPIFYSLKNCGRSTETAGADVHEATRKGKRKS